MHRWGLGFCPLASYAPESVRFLGTGRTPAVAAAALLFGGCGGAGSLSPYAASPVGNPQAAQTLLRSLQSKGVDKIEHVVIIIQENRSFDNLFQGFPGADTQSYGYNEKDRKISLQPVSLATSWDIVHNSSSFFTACNGQGSYPGSDCRMNGFDQESWGCGPTSDPCPNKNPPYSYVPHSETVPYFTMASQYVLGDEMFASNFDGSSFISHQYIIAGRAKSAVNYPDGAWGCDGGSGDTIATVTPERKIPGRYIQACFDETTLGDELDEAGLSWRFYTSAVGTNGGLWSAYQAIRHIYYGSDWSKDVVSPQTLFFTDIKNGELPVVSWITPTYENSDHAGADSLTGPSWVASLVNAVGESKYWKSTVIFIFWDDYGGWYDHVPPQLLDYDGLGIRVPLLIVSAYAKSGYVSHVHYEHGSILRFIEDRFGLARLSASDRRANSPEADCFDFSRAPRPFQVVPSTYNETYFIHQPLDLRPPDTE
jgi:phospholipase C